MLLRSRGARCSFLTCKFVIYSIFLFTVGKYIVTDYFILKMNSTDFQTTLMTYMQKVTNIMCSYTQWLFKNKSNTSCRENEDSGMHRFFQGCVHGYNKCVYTIQDLRVKELSQMIIFVFYFMNIGSQTLQQEKVMIIKETQTAFLF